MLFEKPARYTIYYNDTRWGARWTGFHVACKYGHIMIVEMLIHKSTEFNIAAIVPIRVGGANL